jgi:hypothetical protein
MYKITQYTFDKADELGLELRHSKNPKKKLDVYTKNGDFLASIGSTGYSDYPTYIKSHGLQYANRRREMYFKRHQNDNRLAGLLCAFLLW